jgi:hypothetical protein
MKRLWLALLFFAGGVAQEVRHPTSCETITARYAWSPTRRRSSP